MCIRDRYNIYANNTKVIISDVNKLSLSPGQFIILSDQKSIIEDDENLRFTVKEILEKQGNIVTEASNGKEALMKLNKERNGFEFQSEHLKDLTVNIDPNNTHGNFHESMSAVKTVRTSAARKKLPAMHSRPFWPESRLPTVTASVGEAAT